MTWIGSQEPFTGKAFPRFLTIGAKSREEIRLKGWKAPFFWTAPQKLAPGCEKIGKKDYLQGPTCPVFWTRPPKTRTWRSRFGTQVRRNRDQTMHFLRRSLEKHTHDVLHEAGRSAFQRRSPGFTPTRAADPQLFAPWDFFFVAAPWKFAPEQLIVEEKISRLQGCVE